MSRMGLHIGTRIGIKIGIPIGIGSGGVAPPVSTQYREFTSMVEIVSPLIYDNGSRQFRKIITGNVLYYDIEITATGFSGSVGTDYLRFAQMNYSVALYRHGAEGNYFKIEFNDGLWNTISQQQISGTATLFRDGINDSGNYVLQEWSGSVWVTIETFNVT